MNRRPPGRRLAVNTVHLLRQVATFGNEHQPASRFHGVNLGERMRDLVNLGYLERIVQVGRNGSRNAYRLSDKGRAAIEAHADYPQQHFEPKPLKDRRLCAGEGCLLAETCSRVGTPRHHDTVEQRMCPAGQTTLYLVRGKKPEDLDDPSAVFAWPMPVQFIRQQQDWQGSARPAGPASVWELAGAEA